MNDREQIINLLLQICDRKEQIINQLQVQIAELQKKAAIILPQQEGHGNNITSI